MNARVKDKDTILINLQKNDLYLITPGPGKVSVYNTTLIEISRFSEEVKFITSSDRCRMSMDPGLLLVVDGGGWTYPDLTFCACGLQNYSKDTSK